GCRGGAEVANVTREVREWRDDIVFLHKVKAGAADRSYGIQVARLAGLPKTVTARASEVLALLEKHERRAGAAREPLLEDLPLFAPRAAPPSPPQAPRAPPRRAVRRSRPGSRRSIPTSSRPRPRSMRSTRSKSWHCSRKTATARARVGAHRPIAARPRWTRVSPSPLPFLTPHRSG